VPRARDVELREPGADARPCLPKLGLGVVKIVAGAAVVGGRWLAGNLGLLRQLCRAWPSQLREPRMRDEPCKLCQAQVKLDRHAPPHVGLKLISRGPPYKDMLGAGIDWSYQCLDCGAILFHSTDSPDFGWRF